MRAKCLLSRLSNMTSIEKLEAAAGKLNAAINERDHYITRARNDGYTWEAIAAAADMSRAGVIKAYNRANSGE